MIQKIKNFFKLEERGTTVRTEFTAGLTTFFAMVYILSVNAGMFSGALDVSYGAIYIATALSAVVGTLLIGILANLPLAQASGMGLNAFFVYTACVSLGFTYANALVLVFFEGILFTVLSVTGIRKKLFDAIPFSVRTAISAGIGLFIAFLGLQNAGIVVKSDSTCVTLASFNLMGSASWGSIMPLVVTLATVFFIAILHKKNVKGAVFFGMIGGTVLYYLLGLTVPDFYANLNISVSDPIAAFNEFGHDSFFTVFTQGFNFDAYLAANSGASLVFTIIATSLAFCMVDMFDTLGTFYAACDRGGLVDKDGNIHNMERGMLSDALATTFGAVCGTSTVTTFVESSSGIAEGGRTGLSSVFTALFFAIAMLFSPVAALIPGCATAATLIYVGVLMIPSVKKLNWDSIEVAVPAFLTMAMMPFTYNISYGIAFGMISYVVINAFTGKIKEIKPLSWVIVALFVLMLLFTH